MLKKIFVAAIACRILFTMAVPALAANFGFNVESKLSPGLESVDKSISEFFSSTSSAAIKQIEEDFISSFGKEEDNVGAYKGLNFQPDMSYKVFTLSNENIITVYEKTQNFGDVISENYMLKTPIKNANDKVIAVATFYKINGKWELGAYGKMDSKQTVLSDIKEIMGLLSNSESKSSSLVNIQDMKTVILNKYDTYVIYIKTTDKEYIIPLSTNKLFTALEEKKLYEVSDFFKTLSLNSQEYNNSDSKTSEIQYGGSILTQNDNNPFWNIAIIATSLLGIAVIICVIRKKNLFSKTH